MDRKHLVERVQFWAAVATIMGLFVLLFQVIWGLRGDIKKMREDVKRVEEQTEKSQFRIIYPINGGTVELTDLVRGTTPYPNKNHYIVVTPLETGDDWVQDSPVKIYTGGLWTGRVRFGTAAAGVGRKFIVRAIATKSKLQPKPLTEMPEDAVFSEAVTVIRRK